MVHPTPLIRAPLSIESPAGGTGCFFTEYYFSNHNVQSFAALTCLLLVLQRRVVFWHKLTKKLPLKSIFCVEWCCDTWPYPLQHTILYYGDISPTSHASLTPQCLSPSSAAGGGPKRSRDMEKQWSREVQRYVEASSQIGSKRQINVVAVSLVGFDHPQHYFLLHIYSGQTLL